MPTFNDNMLREIIMDHYQNPVHKKTVNSKEYLTLHSKSENCIDDINIFLKIKNDKVVDCLWDGIACTISSASTDILCGLVIDKNSKDALYVIDNYFKMINEEKFDENALDEAIAFINTSKQAARIKCATIGANAIKDLLTKHHG